MAADIRVPKLVRSLQCLHGCSSARPEDSHSTLARAPHLRQPLPEKVEVPACALLARAQRVLVHPVVAQRRDLGARGDDLAERQRPEKGHQGGSGAHQPRALLEDSWQPDVVVRVDVRDPDATELLDPPRGVAVAKAPAAHRGL